MWQSCSTHSFIYSYMLSKSAHFVCKKKSAPKTYLHGWRMIVDLKMLAAWMTTADEGHHGSSCIKGKWQCFVSLYWLSVQSAPALDNFDICTSVSSCRKMRACTCVFQCISAALERNAINDQEWDWQGSENRVAERQQQHQREQSQWFVNVGLTSSSSACCDGCVAFTLSRVVGNTV